MATDERVEVRVGEVGEAAAARGEAADLEQAHPDAVAGDLPLDPPDADELIDHAVHGGLGEPRPLGQLVQGQRMVCAVEGTDDAVDPPEHRPARPHLVVGGGVERFGGGLEPLHLGVHLGVRLVSDHLPPTAPNDRTVPVCP